VQAAVVEGKVMLGMTREQVVMSIGTPRADLTGDLARKRWVYTATTESDDFDIDFDDAGTVREINASSRVKRLVVYQPEPR
jgi:outer membrane protein assembly factor BamE (lipoprotein component of BamABCDE complex)